jgi:hypothetical protein
MATALIASTLLTGALPEAGFAPALALPTGFAAAGLTGTTLAGADFTALFGFSGGFFGAGCLAFDLAAAAAFAAVAVFDAITVLCAGLIGGG